MMCCQGIVSTAFSKTKPSGWTSALTSAMLILCSGRMGTEGSSFAVLKLSTSRPSPSSSDCTDWHAGACAEAARIRGRRQRESQDPVGRPEALRIRFCAEHCFNILDALRFGISTSGGPTSRAECHWSTLRSCESHARLAMRIEDKNRCRHRRHRLSSQGFNSSASRAFSGLLLLGALQIGRASRRRSFGPITGAMRRPVTAGCSVCTRQCAGNARSMLPESTHTSRQSPRQTAEDGGPIHTARASAEASTCYLPAVDRTLIDCIDVT